MKKLNIDSKYQVICFNKCTSTNTLSKDDKYTYNTILITKHQTNGVGRVGRTFVSNKNKGIYMSIILDSNDIKTIGTLTCLVGVAVSKAIDSKVGCDTLIKWVNDIYLDNKKICGILVERTTNKVIIGIGINTDKQKFDDSLKEKASTIEDLTNIKVSKKELIEQIINNIDELLISNDYMDEYIKRSLVIGKTIKLIFNNEELTVLVKDINTSGNLIVQVNDELKTINSGEVIQTII